MTCARNCVGSLRLREAAGGSLPSAPGKEQPRQGRNSREIVWGVGRLPLSFRKFELTPGMMRGHWRDLVGVVPPPPPRKPCLLCSSVRPGLVLVGIKSVSSRVSINN